MSSPKITSLGALKKTDYHPQNIQEELAKNLRQRLRDGKTTFNLTVKPYFKYKFIAFFNFLFEYRINLLSFICLLIQIISFSIF